MKIVWLSANLFGYEVLKEIIKIINIDTVITLSENSSTKMYDSVDLKKWEILSSIYHMNLIKTNNINEEYKKIKEIEPDYIFMMGWRQIIKKEILELPKYGTIGFHPSLLPFGRGPASIINSILLELKESGSTMFFVNDNIDSGSIISQKSFKIEKNDHAIDVYNKYIDTTIMIFKEQISAIKQRRLYGIIQDESKVVYFPKRTIKDNEISLNNTIEEIQKKIRAFSYPYLGAFIRKGNKKLIFERCKIEEI